MPIDGTAYLKASDGTLVPLSRVGPAGPKGDKGDPGDPGAQGPAGPAGSMNPKPGTDWETTVEGGWWILNTDTYGSPPSNNDWWLVEVLNYQPDWTIQRAYNPFTFGDQAAAEVWVRGKRTSPTAGQVWTGWYRENSLASLADVDAPADTSAGKVLGTTATGQWGPVDPSGGTEVWEGTRAQYDAIASKDPAVLYVITDAPAAIGGHARGDIGSLAVPTATATRITTLSSTNNAGVVVTNSNIKLIEAGYWSITVHLNGLLQAANQRSFISFIVNNNVLARFPAGSPGEAMATASATIYFTANRLLEFDCYTAGAAATVTGKYYIKYLGAT